MRQSKVSHKMAYIPLAVLLLSLLFWFGCESQFSSPTTPEEIQPTTRLSRGNPAVEKAIKAQRNHEYNIMNIPGVVGTGIGLYDNGEPVITIFTEDHTITGIPSKLDNIPVRKKITGRFVAYVDPTTRFDRPVPIGVSVGHPKITAGTIGCRVQDVMGNVYLLSNNHVLANSNEASVGDEILQPGPYDGGDKATDVIGTLYDFIPIDYTGAHNLVDAAIADVTTAMLHYTTPTGAGYGTPGIIPETAFVTMAVQKYGRTTGWTTGAVSEINVTVDVCYQTRGPVKCVKLARFVNQIAITPGTFSAGGDSGSLIVTNDASKSPVALLFAGSDTRTIASPIDAVLASFNVTIDDGSGMYPNIPPTANFEVTKTELLATFTDKSSDVDGSITEWAWDFGDGLGISSEQHPTYTYEAAGTYTVSLTVTDNEEATGMYSMPVTVSEQSSGAIVLTTVSYKSKGRHTIDLTWSGNTTGVDIYRDGILIRTNDTDGFHTDNTGGKGNATYIYKVCETGAQVTCSDEITVIFD